MVCIITEKEKKPTTSGRFFIISRLLIVENGKKDKKDRHGSSKIYRKRNRKKLIYVREAYIVVISVRDCYLQSWRTLGRDYSGFHTHK